MSSRFTTGSIFLDTPLSWLPVLKSLDCILLSVWIQCVFSCRILLPSLLGFLPSIHTVNSGSIRLWLCHIAFTMSFSRKRTLNIYVLVNWIVYIYLCYIFCMFCIFFYVLVKNFLLWWKFHKPAIMFSGSFVSFLTARLFYI